MKSAFDVVDAFTVVGPWANRQPGTPFEFDGLLAEHAGFGIGHRLCLLVLGGNARRLFGLG